MNKVEKFSRENINAIRETINIKLKELEKYGISFELGSIRYADNEFHARLSCRTLNDSKQATDPKAEWNKACIFFGFKPDDYKEQYDILGTTYRFVKFDMRKRKYPVIMQNTITQKLFKFPESYLMNKEALCKNAQS